MAEQEIVFRFIADTADLERALRVLQNDFDGLGDSVEDTLPWLDDASDGMGDTAKNAVLTGSALRQMGSAVSVVSSKGRSAVRVIKGLTAAASAGGAAFAAAGVTIGAIAAPLALVVAGIGAAAWAWQDMTRKIEAHNAVAAQAATASNLMADAALDFKDTIGEASDEFDVFSGATTKTARSIEAYTARVNASAQALKDEILVRQDSNNVSREQLKAIEAKRKAAIEQFTAVRQAEEAERAAADATRERAKADALAAAAAATRAATERALAEERAKNAAKERAEYDAWIDHQVTRAGEGVEASRAAAEAAVANAEAFIEQYEKDQAAIAAGISDTLGGVSDLSGTLAEKLAEDHSKAAKALFRTSQAAGLAQVAVNTAVAITRALAELGPVAGAVASIGIGAAGAAQAAVILAQKPPVAHIGTPAGGALAPDEAMVYGRRTLTTELNTPDAVANSTATGLIDDANNGRLSGGNSRPTVAVIGRSHLDDEVFRSGRNGTTRYSRQWRRNPHPKPQGGW